MQGRDHADIGRAIAGENVLETVVPPCEDDWLPVSGSVAGVDLCGQRIDFVVQLPVLADFSAARRSHLQKHESVAPHGIPLEKPVDRPEPFGYPLCVVHTIDADRQGPLVTQPQGFAERLRVATPDSVLRDALYVDADG